MALGRLAVELRGKLTLPRVLLQNRTPAEPADRARVAGASEPLVWFDDMRGTSKDLPFTDGHGNGNGNNGHGNNEDGVDSSNPNQGHGGANAEGADSDPLVDDEAGGGGASPSNGD